MGLLELLNFTERRAGANPVIISTYSPQAIGIELGAAGVSAPASATAASVGFGSNEAVFVPFHIEAPLTAVKLFCYNGIALAGNVDVGVFSEAGALLVSSGATAQAGPNVLQEFDIADTVIEAGRHYFALSFSDPTATFFWASPLQESSQAMGLAREAGQHPLTTGFALTDALSGIPWLGMSTRTQVT